MCTNYIILSHRSAKNDSQISTVQRQKTLLPDCFLCVFVKGGDIQRCE